MLSRVLDTVLDRTVAPGYSRLGYLLRAPGFSGERADPAPDALRGRVALVTGASAGLGTATVAGLARLGATVHLVVRDTARGERASAAVSAAVPGADLHVQRCDLSSLADVRRAARGLAAVTPDLLVHNAGVLPVARTVTPEGNELALATHVLGPFLLTTLLVDALRSGGDGRIVTVASGGMYAQKLDVDDLQSERGPFSGTAAYARTKRMQVVLSGMWARRLPGVSVHAAHPGWADTPGLADSLPRFRAALRPLLRTPEQGADTVVWLAAAPPEVVGTGRFWHDRSVRPEHYVPWTRESEADRERLWQRCTELSSA